MVGMVPVVKSGRSMDRVTQAGVQVYSGSIVCDAEEFADGDYRKICRGRK